MDGYYPGEEYKYQYRLVNSLGLDFHVRSLLRNRRDHEHDPSEGPILKYYE
jgi:hypothetical protein